jgi:hypothetical protein
MTVSLARGQALVIQEASVAKQASASADRLDPSIVRELSPVGRKVCRVGRSSLFVVRS